MLSFQHFPLLSVLSNLLKTLPLHLRVLCKLKSLSLTITVIWHKPVLLLRRAVLAFLPLPSPLLVPLFLMLASVLVQPRDELNQGTDLAEKITEAPTNGESTAKPVPWASWPYGWMNPSARTWAAGVKGNDPFLSKLNLCQTQLITKLELEALMLQDT